MNHTSTQKPEAGNSCQLSAYIAAHGAEIVVQGKAYRFSNIRNEDGLGFFADVATQRASYLGMQVGSPVIGRPGAEVWEVMRLSGGGAILAKFAIHNGQLLVLA